MRASGRLSAIIALLILAATGVSHAESGHSDSFVLRAGTLLPVAEGKPWRIEDGVIIIRNGRIEAVGSYGDVELPDQLPVVHMPEATVLPGLVNAATSLAGSHRGDHSIGAGYRAIDAFDRFGDYQGALAAGVTTVHLEPGRHRLLSGQGAVVRLGGSPGNRILRKSADLMVTLGASSLQPPDIQEQLVPPASDQEIMPQQPQRPTTRLSQRLALKEAIEAALNDDVSDVYDRHRAALRDAWLDDLPIRVAADRAVDIGSAVTFLTAHERSGYLVGGAEAASVAERISNAGFPLVYTLPASFRAADRDLGDDSGALEHDLRELKDIKDLELALATRADDQLADLRLAAAVAQRAGLSAEQILRAVTSVPARILGVDDRIGSLSPGRDADLLVMTGDPLATSSHVQRVYVRGHVEYRAGGEYDTMVVRGGTIWLGPDEYLEDGSILIENGRISEVGRRVAHPPYARVINVPPGAFVTPGLIDSRGHLGLEGDTSAAGPQLSLAPLIGASGYADHRVARAGVTTVMMTPYNQSSQGSRVAAIKTLGESRSDRVLQETAGVAFELGNTDPAAVPGRLRPRLDAARQYLEAWQRYERELEEWKQRRDEVEAEPEEMEPEEETVITGEPDPISGIWEGRIFGAPIVEPASGRVAVQRDGDTFRGQVIELPQPVDHEIIGEIDGETISGRIEVDTGGMGIPTFEGELEEESAIGTIELAGMTVNFEMERIEKEADVQVLLQRRRGRDDDGRPTAPEVNESLEPLRAVLEERIPLIIEADTAAQIKAALNLIGEFDDFDISVVLVNADDALVHAERLRKDDIPIILHAKAVEMRNGQPHHRSIDLARRNIRFGFQSGAEDGARSLLELGLFAVERGLSPERALQAMTIDAARMYGLEDRIGRIAPGLDADLVIFTGYPFDAGSSVRRVIVNGEELLP